MNDYSTLEKLIVVSIETRDAVTAGALEQDAVIAAVAQSFVTRTNCVMRIIDGRLQALKRRGKIVFNKQHREWEIVR